MDAPKVSKPISSIRGPFWSFIIEPWSSVRKIYSVRKDNWQTVRRIVPALFYKNRMQQDMTYFPQYLCLYNIRLALEMVGETARERGERSKIATESLYCWLLACFKTAALFARFLDTFSFLQRTGFMFSHRWCRHVYGRRLRRTIQHFSSPYGGHQVRLLYFDRNNTLINPSSILVKQRIWKTHPTHSRSSTQYYYSRKHQYVARNSYSDANNGNIYLNRNIIRKATTFKYIYHQDHELRQEHPSYHQTQ